MKYLFSPIIVCVVLWIVQMKPVEQPHTVIVSSLTTAKWENEPGDTSGSQSATLREDPQTGGVEVFVSYPAGYVFPPHWHTANERIILLEGRMSIEQGGKQEFLDVGGYAFLPAKEVQKMACVSKTSCKFYVYWDGKLDFHKASAD